MSLTCRMIIKPMCLSEVYRQSIIFSDFQKRIPYKQFMVCYSSKSCDSGKSDKSSSKSSGSGSDQTTCGKSDEPSSKGSAEGSDKTMCIKSDESSSPCSGSGSDKKTGEGGGDPSDDNPSSPSMYDLRKYGHCLPRNDICMYFEPLPHIPTGIFRNTDDENLGLGAGKCCLYKNPEYFSFHHMTYYDMHLIMRCFRKPSPKTGRKP